MFWEKNDTENNLKHYALLGCRVILFFLLHSCPAMGKIAVRSETQDWFHNSTRDWSLSLFLKCYRFHMLQFKWFTLDLNDFFRCEEKEEGGGEEEEHAEEQEEEEEKEEEEEETDCLLLFWKHMRKKHTYFLIFWDAKRVVFELSSSRTHCSMWQLHISDGITASSANHVQHTHTQKPQWRCDGNMINKSWDNNDTSLYVCKHMYTVYLL